MRALELCVILLEVLRKFAAGNGTAPVRVNGIKSGPQLLLAAANVARHSSKLGKVEAAICIHVCRRELAVLLARSSHWGLGQARASTDGE